MSRRIPPFPQAAGTAAALTEHGAQLCYLAIVTTAVAQWLQALGQSRVSAQDATIVYALDPVYAAAFSFLLLGETLGPQGFAGNSNSRQLPVAVRVESTNENQRESEKARSLAINIYSRKTNLETRF